MTERLTKEQIEKAIKYYGDKFGFCPECGGPLIADEVDIGVGIQKCSPARCDNCHYVEKMPTFKDIKWKID